MREICEKECKKREKYEKYSRFDVLFSTKERRDKYKRKKCVIL